MEKTSLAGVWRLKNGELETEGRVPGDIADDLLRAGLISDPYVGYNYRDSLWVQESDWTLERTFTADAGLLRRRCFLCFEGVDTLSEVFVNDRPVGRTDSMFLEYRFPLEGVLKEGENTLRVELKSPLKAIAGPAQTRYDSVFCANRIFLRKAQCHFGWDWAPKFPGYGIYRDVFLMTAGQNEIEEVRIRTSADGGLTFFVTFEERFRGQMRVRVLEEGRLKAEASAPVDARRKLLNLRLSEPRLWWPNGYGEAFLYDYELILEGEDGPTVHTGRFGIREVRLAEPPLDPERLGFAFEINGRQVFARGSNWVPAECMTGRLTAGRYDRLVELAAAAGFNMLRVWGGGIYESEDFYRACDRAGIMVWQDFMFACQEIPDDEPGFLEKLREEASFQIRRLRGHPCLVYWCGMNEGRGAFQPGEPRFGERAMTLLQGLTEELDGTRPFRRMSPVGFSDIQNDDFLGDSHNNCTEVCLFREGFTGFEQSASASGPEEDLAGRIRSFSLFLEESPSNFTSECAVLGACGYHSLTRFIPEEHRKMGDPIFEDRFLGNPYTYVMPSFYERQRAISAALYGEAEDLRDFVKKCNRAQMDILESEIVFARCNGRTTGFLSWMYNDIWPTGTWSAVDYYLDLKPAYYAMKRRFRPLMCAFLRLREGIRLHLVNNGPGRAEGRLELGLWTYAGERLNALSFDLSLERDGRFSGEPGFDLDKGDYLWCRGEVGGSGISEIFDLRRYLRPAYDPRYAVRCLTEGKERVLEIEAETFVPCLRAEALDAGGEPLPADFSDNYFDVAAGEKRRIRVSAPPDAELRTTDFTRPWER